ncbi:putative carboxylesterase 2 [Platanthera guangdongensis]|uniref:Carboxylesterase 2 n=1 Tax=Platanthera guangdongensis TaxID=2320717 RepID=A0ABR2LIL3_9ASPA
MESDPIVHDFSPLFRQYKSGSVERLAGTAIAAPAPVDPVTGVATKRVVIDPITPVSACLYIPPNLQASSGTVPLLLYFHGGAFCIQSAFSPTYHPHLTALAARANLLVVSSTTASPPSIPSQPPTTTAGQPSIGAFSRADPWLADHGDLRRDGIKGGAEGTDPFEGMVLVHPYFWGSEAIVGETEDVGKRAWMAGLWRAVCGGAKGLDEKWIDPAKEEEIAVMRMACRRVMVCVAERDLMRARGRAYWEMLKRSTGEGRRRLWRRRWRGMSFTWIAGGDRRQC